MKKFLVLALMVIMVFTLVACGEKENITPSGNNNENTSTNPPISQGDDNVKPNNNNKAVITTVEDWLSYWSLTEDDLKPANFTRLDKTAYNIDTLEIKDVGAYINKGLTEEEARAWIEKVISKLNSLSEEGKLTNIANDEELTVDYIMGLNMRIASGTFTYKGKKATALISVMPRALDNADPDEAMPACSLSLNY